MSVYYIRKCPLLLLLLLAHAYCCDCCSYSICTYTHKSSSVEFQVVSSACDISVCVYYIVVLVFVLCMCNNILSFVLYICS